MFKCKIGSCAEVFEKIVLKILRDGKEEQKYLSLQYKS